MATDQDSLDVWRNQRLVGRILRNQKRMGFRYDERWMKQGGFAISHSLPFNRGGVFEEGGEAGRYFGNLLPEESFRRRIVRALRIPDTDFSLLKAIGGECAGALSILPAGERPDAEHSYREASITRLTDPFLRRREISRPGGKGIPRLSLAGAQDKCPVLFRDGAFFLPEGNAASSHIIKFQVPDFPRLPANETFTTMLAEAIGLPVVDIELRVAGDESYMLIKRYDRQVHADGRIIRLHQEDFCQALDVARISKYEENDGPRLADCCRLLGEVSEEADIDQERLLRWQIFNVLAGNSDGHAKNLSLLRLPGGEVRLAPFYDLICTRAYEGVDHHLAFSVGRTRDPDIVSPERWSELAWDCNLNPRHVHGWVRDVAARLAAAFGPVRQRFEESHGAPPVLGRIEDVVKQQCRRVADAMRQG